MQRNGVPKGKWIMGGFWNARLAAQHYRRWKQKILHSFRSLSEWFYIAFQGVIGRYGGICHILIFIYGFALLIRF